MTHDEFVSWLQDEVSNRRMTQDQTDDLLAQKKLFDLDRGLLESSYQARIVGYIAEQRRDAGDIHELLEEAKTSFPGRMIYFEPIGFDLF